VNTTTDIRESRTPRIDSKQPVRILCVDDNQDLADSEAMLLELAGFEARACYDGFSALELAKAFHPYICLIDLNMPRMDGDELAQRLQKRVHSVVLVALTARSDQESTRRIRNAGFAVHLVKPVDPKELIRVLNGLRKRDAASDLTRDEKCT
jgi:DNA-binding response OmpR family regulator